MNPSRQDNSNAGAPPLGDSNAGQHDADDARLLAAVQEYMRALETGHRPNRREFLARYPDIADELSECLDGLAFVHSAAVEIPGAAAPPRAPKEPHSDIDIENARPLGDFRLIREIGRGGMGIVYEAVQLTLGRKVAVKVLPMAAALDARHLERFRNEAQAAAQLHHTNIVPVYAVGCERSVHFYAMQLIEGQSLSEVIHDLRQLAAPASDASKYDLQADPHDAVTLTWRPGSSASTAPTKNSKPPEAAPRPAIDRSLSDSNFSPQSLSTLRNTKGAAYSRSVANLGLQVAQALDYAHRAGVVHRDIKPANLLLDAKGTLWITDFGLAQFYTDNNLTRSGDMVGTMRYMSPEQASGRAVVLDQRTDIYSLGVTLYELLTLERALPGTTHAQLLDQLVNHDPRPARAVDKTIPRELEIILAKAMAKDPADRYQSADLLAADLQRFLTDQPIHARPPSLWDKSVKWTRRHRSLALSTLVTLAIIAIGLLISTLLIAREQGHTKTAYDLEAQKAIEANQQRARAEKSSRQARDAVDFFSRIAQSINDPKFDDVRREMLEESLNYYQSFLEDRSDNQAVNAELDAAKARVSNLLSRLLALDASLRAAARVHLVTFPAVQEDLKLTPAEIKAANELASQFDRKRDDEFLEMGQMPPEQRRQHLPAGAIEIETKLNSLLGERAERLRQIQRQDRGPLAFSDADVVEKLALTRDQRAKIRTLQSNFREARFGPGHWQESFDDLRNRAAATVNEILAKLNDSQRQTWQELIGPKIAGKLPMNSLFGPRGPGRGGPDGGRGGPDGGGGPGGRGPGRGGGPPDGGPGGGGPGGGANHNDGPGHPGGRQGDGPEFDQPRRGI